MTTIEPGTYRIVNLARNKSLRVPDEYPDTIASWHSQDELNQKWIVERAGEGYRFKNCEYGKYLSVPSAQCSSQAYHGPPTTWKIIPQMPRGYLIQLEAADLVLDLHDRGEVYIWPSNNVEPQKVWEFERLGGEMGEELGEKGISTHGKVGQDPAANQPASRDEGAANKSSPSPNSLASGSAETVQQAQQIQSLQNVLSEKEQELRSLREELDSMRARESSQVTTLREKITQMEELVERLFEQESRRPNNAA